MNKRARNRLIIGAAIIVVIGAAGFMLSLGDSQEIKTVSGLAAMGDTAVGVRMKVTGSVIGTSWDGKANPMRFEITDEGTATADPAVLKVVYSGVAPGGFGDKTKATLTGELGSDGVFTATDMLTVCPTKYETAQAMTVAQLLAGTKTYLNQTVRVTGYPTAAPADGAFTMDSRADGGESIVVKLTGAAPEGIGKGAFVQVTGELLEDGTFRASKVQVNKKAQ